MINQTVENKIIHSITQLMIPADNVAHVLDSNTLSHGMLILSTVKYSVIPVLSKKSQLLGLINMPLMIKAVTSVDAIEVDKLDDITIGSIMQTDLVTVTESATFERILHLLVDQNFICVVDDQNIFKGIITRREMLKRVNHFLHDISVIDHLKSLLIELSKSDN